MLIAETIKARRLKRTQLAALGCTCRQYWHAFFIQMMLLDKSSGVIEYALVPCPIDPDLHI